MPAVSRRVFRKSGYRFCDRNTRSFKLRAFSFGKPEARFAGKCSRAGAVVTQAVSNSLAVARGGVGCHPGSLREKIGANEGGLSQSSPFFFWRLASCGDPD